MCRGSSFTIGGKKCDLYFCLTLDEFATKIKREVHSLQGDPIMLLNKGTLSSIVLNLGGGVGLLLERA